MIGLALLVGFLYVPAQAETKLDLPATVKVTVSTNVASGDNASGCLACYHRQPHGFNPFDALDHEPYHPPTERWVSTNVVETTRLETVWRGKQLTHVEQRTLWSVTNRFTLVSEWKPTE